MWKGGLPVHLNIQNKEDQHQSHQYSLFKNNFVSLEETLFIPDNTILYNDEKEDGDDDGDDDSDNGETSHCGGCGWITLRKTFGQEAQDGDISETLKIQKSLEHG